MTTPLSPDRGRKAWVALQGSKEVNEAAAL
jgi:hypothetical protein